MYIFFVTMRKHCFLSFASDSLRQFNMIRILAVVWGPALGLLCFGPTISVTQPTFPSHEQYINELINLGYLQQVEIAGEIGQTVSAEDLAVAIKAYQSNYGLPTSGDFDESTRYQMSLPRCGNPDKYTGSSRWPRFAATSGWSQTHITWNVVNYTQDLVKEKVDDSITRAFQLWSDETVLTFERVSGTGDEVDIRIDFYEPYIEHGDDLPFDGPGHVLAHAFLPWFSRLKGDIHFDDGETWTHMSYSGANMWLVAAHEIGHSLGLQHSFIQGSLMYPYHSGYMPDFQLHTDDIQGIEAMYGDGTPDFVTQKPGGPNNPLVPRLCLEHFDSIDVGADGYTYVYKGDYYWQLELGQIVEGYPKLISQGWPGLQNDIDAALTVKNVLLWTEEVVGKTFFFKGRAVWRYSGRSLDIGYPKDLTDVFPGFPNSIQHVTAAVEISGNGQTFFIADGVFFMYTWRKIVEGPYSLNAFRSIPSNLADAVQLRDNYIYFFTKDLQYFQVSPWTFTPSYGYPRQTTEDWFGCTNTARPVRIETDAPDNNHATLLSHNVFTAILLIFVSVAIL